MRMQAKASKGWGGFASSDRNGRRGKQSQGGPHAMMWWHSQPIMACNHGVALHKGRSND